jgi:hypothetical protein
MAARYKFLYGCDSFPMPLTRKPARMRRDMSWKALPRTLHWEQQLQFTFLVPQEVARSRYRLHPSSTEEKDRESGS